MKKIVKEDKYSLVIAVLSDQSVKSEIAWRLPYKLMQRIGEENYNPYWIVNNQELIHEALKTKPALHRFPRKIADYIISMSRILINDYDGSANNLLTSTRDYNDFVEKFKEIKGISDKKANLMFLILFLDFKINFSNCQDSKALLDVHIKRYLENYLGYEITQQDADELFQKIDPKNPARVSPFLWNKLRNA